MQCSGVMRVLAALLGLAALPCLFLAAASLLEWGYGGLVLFTLSGLIGVILAGIAATLWWVYS